MAISLARLLRDGEVVFHGLASPLPMVATMLARALHAPNLVYLTIGGAVDPRPSRLPYSTVDPALLEGVVAVVSLAEIFDLSARGKLDTVFLSGVQIDRQGRINTTVIGTHGRPKVRLPGGAGSALLMPTARRTLLWRTRHDRRTLVEKCDFVTAAGEVDRLVTPMAVFRREEGSLRVESLHPGYTWQQVEENTGFALEPLPGLPVGQAPATPEPGREELDLLARIDPRGVRHIEF